jgi:predicted amidophosphoribosyltransferase
MKEQNEKQAIEEMATLMDGVCDVMPLGECYTVDCNKCKAALLYNADYSKQRVGEWEKRVFIIFDSEKVGYRCSECNTTWDTATPYCPNCGARMKGGAE